jgi:gliding motility-associated-like protein
MKNLRTLYLNHCLVYKRISVALLVFIIFAISSFADGTKQFMPDENSRTSLYLGRKSFGSMAQYNGDIDSRLNIYISDPENEIICFGFGQFSFNFYHIEEADVYVRIKDPSGNVVWPNRDSDSGYKFSSTTVNIDSYTEAVKGSNIVNGLGGYDELVFDPSGLESGDYYFEFSLNETTASNHTKFYTHLWDITVVNKSSNSEIKGRLYSKKWTIGTPEFFRGKVYAFCDVDNSDKGYVSEVNFYDSKMRGMLFSLSLNSFGTSDSDDVNVNKRSVSNIAVFPEYKLFLTEPDINVYPNAEPGGFTLDDDYPRLIGCPPANNSDEGLYYFKVKAESEGYVQLLLDFNNNGVYDYGTKDVILRTLIKPYPSESKPYVRDIKWNGKNGLGEGVYELPDITASFEYFQGTIHFNAFDVEGMEVGIIPKTVRPLRDGDTGDVKLYWDDREINGDLEPNSQEKVNITGVLAPSHTWAYSEVGSYGDVNTICTYWSSYSSSVQRSMGIDMATSGCENYEPSIISGTVYEDLNGNGERDIEDKVKKGVLVRLYEDVNVNGKLDDEDIEKQSIESSDEGKFSFKPHIGKTYILNIMERENQFVSSSNEVVVKYFYKSEEYKNNDFSVVDLPEIESLTFEKSNINEENDSTELTLVLSKSAVYDAEIKLNYFGTANDSEYSVRGKENTADGINLKIPSGKNSASIVVKSIDDYVTEYPYDYVVAEVESVNNVYESKPFDARLSITDDDIVRLRLYYSDGNKLITNENGSNDYFEIALGRKPTSDVTINISGTDDTEVTADTQQLIFTPDNWIEKQKIVVTGKDDPDIDSDINYNYIVSIDKVNSAAEYLALGDLLVDGINIDNDTPRIFVSDISNHTDETGKAAIFRVRLSSRPTADVIIPIISSDISEGVTEDEEIVIPVNSWNKGVFSKVIGENDDVFDEDKPYKIITELSKSADIKFNKLESEDVDVINDNILAVNDTDGDGISDYIEWDTNGDGIGPDDADGDGISNYEDLDSDGDGISDEDENDPNNDGIGLDDSDGDKIPDFLDIDSDGDTYSDEEEGITDCDYDGIPDYLDHDSCRYKIPNGFSPNGDGKNDQFVIEGLNPHLGLRIEIFNRWGTVVYVNNNYNNDWDGTANVSASLGSNLPIGSYFFVLRIKDTKEELSGDIFMVK